LGSLNAGNFLTSLVTTVSTFCGRFCNMNLVN
jgi:hypothetical protein